MELLTRIVCKNDRDKLLFGYTTLILRTKPITKNFMLVVTNAIFKIQFNVRNCFIPEVKFTRLTMKANITLT